MSNYFTSEERDQIAKHGLTPQTAETQMKNFERGFDFLRVNRAAGVDDGITVLSVQREQELAYRYDNRSEHLQVTKFVPASGAATRMLKVLFEYVDGGKSSDKAEQITSQADKFAFYDIIKSRATDPLKTASAILEYGAELPKALILFHKYPDGNRTALEEHLVEGAAYATTGGCARLHFTISAEHEQGFTELLQRVKPKYESLFGIKYDISFSRQKSSTDTIAVNPDNSPFREKDGSLLFRPAGHGALIENLNEIDADVIFIKNIDNVTPDHLKGDTIRYKKIIAGLLLEVQQTAFNYLNTFQGTVTSEQIEEVADFTRKSLCYRLPDGFERLDTNSRKEALRSVLDRPIRVCAMVRNEGEPGGGPFWVNNLDGSQSLQIGESAQISPSDEGLFRSGTHFNPVDIVCGVKNHKGEKFDLKRYVDPATGFITEKSKDGRPLKAQELPGLWNGAMANWNTIFIEVPISTFTPVKEVSDLLRPQHQ